MYGSGAWGLLGCKVFFEQENHQVKREAAFCSHYKYSGDEVTTILYIYRMELVENIPEYIGKNIYIQWGYYLT